MPLAALAALALFAAEPAKAAPALAPQKPAAADPASIRIEDEDDDGVPQSAPKDDYRFVAWCYGALDEYLQIYDQVKPDLKAIDKMFGTPVKEDEPYHDDVAEDRKALKRFAGAIEAAEKASVHPIAPDGAAAMQSGREIWSAAKLEPHRKLADAWLFWGLPNRCDRVARQLKERATLMGQAFAIEAPQTDAPQAGAPAPSPTPPVGIDASDLAAPPAKPPAGGGP
jgi:hypothetical protein